MVKKNASYVLKKATRLRKELPEGCERVRFSVRACKIDEDKNIITGEVYAPNIIDTHNEMMLVDDVEQLAYDFMAKGLNDHIDIMHNNKPALATAVESFIAKGHKEYNEGAWVLSVKVFDQDLWDEIKKGKYNGYSMEAMVRKIPAVVEVEYERHVFGITEEGGNKNDRHNHVFHVELDDNGKIVRGRTDEHEDGTYHTISLGTATQKANDHNHRYFLP